MIKLVAIPLDHFSVAVLMVTLFLLTNSLVKMSMNASLAHTIMAASNNVSTSMEDTFVIVTLTINLTLMEDTALVSTLITV